MVKKHLAENPFASGTGRLLKQVVLVKRGRIQADDQVTRLQHMHALFLCSLQKSISPMPVDLQELHDRTVNATALAAVTFLKKL
jgi:hypothetical protein